MVCKALTWSVSAMLICLCMPGNVATADDRVQAPGGEQPRPIIEDDDEETFSGGNYLALRSDYMNLMGYGRLVVLRYRHGQYLIDIDLMRKRPLDPDELRIRAGELNRISESFWERPELVSSLLLPKLRGSMAQLIYGGNAHQAFELLNMVWPPEVGDYKEFIREFYFCRLRTSKYWDAIAAMNNVPADPPVGDC